MQPLSRRGSPAARDPAKCSKTPQRQRSGNRDRRASLGPIERGRTVENHTPICATLTEAASRRGLIGRVSMRDVPERGPHVIAGADPKVAVPRDQGE